MQDYHSFTVVSSSAQIAAVPYHQSGIRALYTMPVLNIRGKHGAKWIREEALTEQFAQVFKSLQMPADIHQHIVQSLQELHKSKIEFHTHFEKFSQEQKTLTKMMDNLYLDKLKGRISDEQYDTYYASFH